MSPLAIFFLFLINSSLAANTNINNVQNYGAKSDGNTDSSKAFFSAWAAACASNTPATINVPIGKYLIHNANFNGQTCKSKAITIHIDGTLLAPSDYNVIDNDENWIKFEKVSGVSIYGGTFDGQGAGLWACQNSNNKNCPDGTTTLTFYNSNNITMSGVTVQNSQKFQILVDVSHNVKLQGMKVLAQGNSKNTDGIHVKLSSGVRIMKSQIGTGDQGRIYSVSRGIPASATAGDDCISISPGNSNLWIEGIACGPGHGISIGSLGWKQQELGVQNVTIKTVTFSGTTNGVRVKTWAIIMMRVVLSSSGIKISDVTYQAIHETSATKIAVKLDCSITNPCRGVVLEDLNLSYQNQQTEASCVNARGRVSGLQKPNNCLLKN
ncbi:hypothetical protein H5410_006895 [Solanum commersonii]|uniref:Polygalacturonase n=1 Tax=Solanum commersonii TaxID=4109 RepID=A0A9J6AAK8_SOLCO|nr:hypothetical protein H5410_006895 [Solanum commersonii]